MDTLVNDLQNKLQRKYSAFVYKKPKVVDKCKKNNLSSNVELGKHQAFLRSYMKTEKSKGVLVYHGAGTGKTCAAVAAMGPYIHDPSWRVLWVTRRTLKGGVLRAIFKDGCIQEDYRKGKMFREAYRRGDEILSRVWRRFLRGFPKKHICTYGNIVRALAKARSREDLTRALGNEDLRERGMNDPLRKTLIVVDEAHNLYNMIDFRDADFDTLHKRKHRWRTTGERLTGIEILEQSIWRSYAYSKQNSCKLLLLTATPFTISPLDGFSLINLLQPNPRLRIPLSLNIFLDKNGKMTKAGKEIYLRASFGKVSYFSGVKDPGYFAMKRWGSLIRVKLTHLQEKALKECNLIQNKEEKVVCFRRVENIASLKGNMCSKKDFDETQKKNHEAFKKYNMRLTQKYNEWLRDERRRMEDHLKSGEPFQTFHHRPFKHDEEMPSVLPTTCQTSFSFVVDSKKNGKWSFKKNLFKQAMPTIAPKLVKLFDVISKLDKRDKKSDGRVYKHMIYTDTAGPGGGRSHGSKLLLAAFASMGFKLGYTKGKGKQIKFMYPENYTAGKKENKTFAVLTSSSIFGQDKSNARTQAIIKAFNEPKSRIRFILLDDSFKEGIDLFDVKYIHILEPPYTFASYRQAIARAVRRCGSTGLPYQPSVGWEVEVFIYEGMLRKRSMYNIEMRSLPDQLTLSMRGVDAYAALMQKAAIDYKLNEKILTYEPYSGFSDALVEGKKVLDSWI